MGLNSHAQIRMGGRLERDKEGLRGRKTTQSKTQWWRTHAESRIKIVITTRAAPQLVRDSSHVKEINMQPDRSSVRPPSLCMSACVLPRELALCVYRWQPSARLLHKSNCGAALLAFNCYFTTVVVRLQQLATQLCCRRDISGLACTICARRPEESPLRFDAQLLIFDFIGQAGECPLGSCGHRDWTISN